MQIETFVKLSGLTKQDYITRRLTCKDVVVQGNPRVYKALRDQLAAVLNELRRIEAGGSVSDELLDVIDHAGGLIGPGGQGPAQCLGQNDVKDRLEMGHSDGAGGHHLAVIHRLDGGAENLQLINAAYDRQRERTRPVRRYVD